MADRKRCYYVHEAGENIGLAVVASSAREAKKLLRDQMLHEFYVEHIDIRVQWQREVDVSRYELGHIFDGDRGMTEGVIIGAYAWTLEGTCQRCREAPIFIRHIDKPPFAVCELCEIEIEEDE